MGSAAGGIVAGTARVIIAGDYSRLASDFQRAQGIAATGSTQIASAVTSAFGASSGLVDQFGRAIVSTTTQVVAAAPPVLDLAAGVQRLALAEALLKQAIDDANASAGHQVSQLQAVSGAIRVALGEQSIRAAERFLSLIPGIGAALQVAFPVIGALALGDALFKAVGNVIGLKDAEEQLAKATDAADKAMAKLGRTLDQNTAQHVTREFGPGAGDIARAQELERLAKAAKTNFDDLSDDIRAEAEKSTTFLSRMLIGVTNLTGGQAEKAALDRIKALGQQVKQTGDEIADMQAQAAELREQAAKDLATEGGQAGAARTSGRLEALQRQTEAQRTASKEQIDQALQLRTAEINAIDDSTERAIAASRAKVEAAQASEAAITEILAVEVPKRIALENQKASTEGAGKDKPEQERIAIETANRVAAIRGDADKEILAAHNAVIREENDADETYASQLRELLAGATHAWEEFAGKRKSAVDQQFTTDALKGAFDDEAQTRAAATLAKGAGQQRELEIEGQKIALENQYNLAIVKTGTAKIQYAQEIAVLDAEAREARLQGLQADLSDAEAIAKAAEGTEAYVGALERVAVLKNQVAALSEQNANAEIKGAGQVGQAQAADNLGRTIASDISEALSRSIPQSISGALARGLFEHNRNESIGKEVGQAGRQTAEQLTQKLLSATMTKLIEQIGIQTGVQAAGNAVTAANTGATVAHTAATIGSTISTIANTVATDLNTIWLAIKSFLGFAEGGDPPVGVPSIVGEKGPELFIPKSAGTILPAGTFASGPRIPPAFSPNDTRSAFAGYSSTANTTATNHITVNVHGIQDPARFTDHVMRQLPDRLKARYAGFAPYSR